MADPTAEGSPQPSPTPRSVVDVVHADDAVIVVDETRPGSSSTPEPGTRTGRWSTACLHRFPELAGVGDPGAAGHRAPPGCRQLGAAGRGPDAGGADRAVPSSRPHGRPALRRGAGPISTPRTASSTPRIGRDPADPLKMAVVVDGKPARTEYHVVAELHRPPADLARLSCRLETGRTHQIRVHLAAVGYPLLGDPTYGERRTTLGLTRPFLHAAELSFDHPDHRPTPHLREPPAPRPRRVPRT